MDADLEDVGLNALEAMEAQDAETTDTTNTEGEEPEVQDTNETADAEDAGVEENETNDEVGSDEEPDKTPDEGNKEEDNSDTETKVEEKKELSDEEFEELAKKRGYAKAPSEEEVKEKQASESRMEQLLACPEEIDERVWAQLPNANKLIYNALPYITAEGKDGETYTVKTPDQLPDDFEFASKKAEAKFYNDLQAQEMKATRMSEALNQRSERIAEENARHQEAVRVISEVEALQKTGDLPTPTAKQGTAEFDRDPAVELINKVLDYRTTRMREGVNLTIKDSLMLYKAQHPDEFEKKEARGDAERKNIAKKIAGGSKASGTPANAKEKPQYYRPGMTTEEVIDRVLDDMD